ncbi:hypothetical protein [Fodinicola feengrottensis]|uniref:Secreted protein n=1 Tax=Fodinicola feengrottensis TaxID=435914 RepID=A0ABN2FT44_9ACTN|nr:hypothetical protein [Fodinicola feengrottensis]
MRKILAACLLAGSAVALATAMASPAQASTSSVVRPADLACSDYNDAHGTAYAVKCSSLPPGYTQYAAVAYCSDGSVQVGDWVGLNTWSEAYCSGTSILDHGYVGTR